MADCMDCKDYARILFAQQNIHALSEFFRYDNLDLSALILDMLGSCHMDVSRLDKSLKLFQDADSIYKSCREIKTPNHIDIVFHLASCLKAMGDYTQAIAGFKLCLVMCRILGNEKRILMVEHGIGLIHMDCNSFEQLLMVLQESNRRAFLDGDAEDRVVISTNLGVCLKKMGLYREVIIKFEYSKNDYVLRNMTNNQNYVVVLIKTEECLGLLGEYDKASQCYEHACVIGYDLENKQIVTIALLDFGIFMWKRGLADYITGRHDIDVDHDITTAKKWLKIALLAIDAHSVFNSDDYQIANVHMAYIAYIKKDEDTAFMCTEWFLEEFVKHMHN